MENGPRLLEMRKLETRCSARLQYKTLHLLATVLHQQKIENPMRPREAIAGVVNCHMYYNILQTSYKYRDASDDLCLFS